MQPVSVVATVLNEAGDIESMVRSLLAQKPPAAMVIVVDGGSTDGTWEKIAAIETQDARLKAIRDERCNLQHSPGPIARGRNVAIAAAKTGIVACADAGCTYAPDWLANLTAPLRAGAAEYALGGSCLDTSDCTLWDVAAAPFFGIRLAADAPTKSSTARSMTFTKSLWERTGGFPEHVLLGEDTLFDLEARRHTAPAFISNAKAFYRPQFTWRSALDNMGRYAFCDGQARVRWMRLFRNAARCVVEALAVACLVWSPLPLLAILVLEAWVALRCDWRQLGHFGIGAVAARFVFSLAVPWVVAVNHIRGLFIAQQLSNKQNEARESAREEGAR